MKLADLPVNIGALSLKNPVMAASGTFGFGLEFGRYGNLASLGAVVTKSLTLQPRAGNPGPRIWETPSGMLNAIGLENPGFAYFKDKVWPLLKDTGATVIVNIAAESIEEYASLAESAGALEGIAGLEINASCPNVEAGGIQFGREPGALAELVAACRCRCSLPLIVKLTPNVTDIVALAGAAIDAGADALSAINTLLGMSVDVRARLPRLANVTGGLSGPAIRPVALRCCYEISRAGMPVIGAGGICDLDSALEFILVGAAAVQVGTANFLDPGFVFRLPELIAGQLREMGLASIAEYRGSLRLR